MENIIIRNVKREDLRQVSEIAVKGWQTAYRGIIDDEYLDNLSIEDKYQKQLKNYNEYGMHDFIVAELNNKDRIVGMINIRLVLNERLKKIGGHIGYILQNYIINVDEAIENNKEKYENKINYKR